MALFQELNARGLTIIQVTHEPDIARHGTRLLRLRDGRMAAQESVRERLLAERVLAAWAEVGDGERGAPAGAEEGVGPDAH